MCFSPEVSFASAGVLVGLGVYSLHLARRRLPSYWAFALIPLGFGIQQAAEGFVWLGILHHNEAMTRWGSAVFQFFAALWPAWFPLAAAVAEPGRWRRALLFTLALLSTAWIWFAYLPALLGQSWHVEA